MSFDNEIKSVLVKEPIESYDASFEETNVIFSTMKAHLEFVQSGHHRVDQKKSKYTKYLKETNVVIKA
jgi:hypothetical protein